MEPRMNAEVYKPIDCDYYDTLEVLAMRRKECVIVYIDKHRQSQTVKTVIEDVLAKGGEEFIRLENGQLIRLDHLLVVDHRPVPLDSCSIVHVAGQPPIT